MATKKVCKCEIRGVIEMYKVGKNWIEDIHPDRRVNYLRKFNFCPICGKKIKEAGR